MDAEPEWRVITTKFKTHCRRCYRKIKKGSKVRWYPEKKTVRHVYECEKRDRPVATHRPAKGRVRFVTGR